MLRMIARGGMQDDDAAMRGSRYALLKHNFVDREHTVDIADRLRSLSAALAHHVPTHSAPDHPLERRQGIDDAFAVATREQARVENDHAAVVVGAADQPPCKLGKRA